MLFKFIPESKQSTVLSNSTSTYSQIYFCLKSPNYITLHKIHQTLFKSMGATYTYKLNPTQSYQIAISENFLLQLKTLRVTILVSIVLYWVSDDFSIRAENHRTFT